MLFLHFCDLGDKNATRLLRTTAFLTEGIALFLRVCKLASKGCYKATTRNGVPHGGKVIFEAIIDKKCLTECI